MTFPTDDLPGECSTPKTPPIPFETALNALLNGSESEKIDGSLAMRRDRALYGYGAYLEFLSEIDILQTLPAIRDMLETKCRDIRLEGVLLLRGKRNPDVKKLLINMMEIEDDPYVRSALVINIGAYGDQNDIPTMVSFLADTDERVRANAIEALGRINDARIVEHVLPFLTDPNNRVKANAVKLLYRFERLDNVYNALKEMIKSDQEKMQSSAVYLLREIDTVRSLDLLLGEDAETFVENRAKNLELLQSVETRQDLENRMEALGLQIDALRNDLKPSIDAFSPDSRDKFDTLLDFKARYAALSTHRVHLSAISLSLQRQIEIERLHTELSRSHQELQTTKNALEELNSMLEFRVMEKTMDLQKSKEFMESILTSLNTGVVVADRDLLVMEINPAARSILHLTGDIIGKKMDEIDTFTVFRPIFDQILKNMEPVQRHEATIAPEPGKPRVLGISASPVIEKGSNMRGVVAVFQDITHTKELEARLVMSEKMKTLGLLSSTISHDFNNLLMGILGFSSLLKESATISEDDLENVTMIHDSATEARDIVRQVLSVSREHPPERAPLNIVDLLGREGRILRISLPENINLQVSTKENIPMIYADRAQINQMLMNLIINAKDAMPEGGTIHIGLETRILNGEKYSTYLCITIKDEGLGISNDDINKIFDPFFTTKTGGKGTGLGCTIIYNVVKKHDGLIKVSSAPDKGTVFEICLPALTYASINLKTGSKPIDLSGKKIAVVEDEPVALKFISESLNRSGATVYSSDCGEKALREWVENNAAWWPPDLIMVDMYLPGIDGLRLIEAIAMVINPMPPVLFMSGHAGRETFERMIERTSGDFIQKPFDKIEMLGAVAAILERNKKSTAPSGEI